MKAEKIRNFAISAHIDHGKSTLADRLLEITGTVAKENLVEQYLDRMDLERERGITIKLAPVSVSWKSHQLNLIDTPGHVDFSYEVSRSLAAVEGIILLVDATQGIEAQTLSNFLLAKEQGLTIIPTINKIDLPSAQTQEVKKSIRETLGFPEEDILLISAKVGTGVEVLLDKIIEKIPSPEGNPQTSLKALVFDSVYDSFKGVVAYIRLFDGRLKKGEKVKLLGIDMEFETAEVGHFSPDLVESQELGFGEIGYIATGLKDVSKVAVGDTLTLAADPDTHSLPGYKPAKPAVFAGIFPIDRDEFTKLKEAIEKLKLNDASLIFELENSPHLGFGVRAGFLGLLHLEVVVERLQREFDISLVITAPTVSYRVLLTDGTEVEVSNPTKLPDLSKVKEITEPWVEGSVITRSQYLGPITQLIHEKRGEIVDIKYFSDKVDVSVKLPLSEIISDFYDKLKTISSGYASFDWEPAEYRSVASVKLEILVAKEPVDALSQIVPKEKAYPLGKALVEKLRQVIPRQQFEVSLQAAVGGKIVASEKIPAFRKDVTAKLYGGDRTRKDKLLDKQKKGKKKMKMIGGVEIPQEAFLSVLKV